MEKIDAIHKMHMDSMSKTDAAAAMEKMKPMMQKMESEKAMMTSHMMQLDRALQTDAPDAQAVAMHTAFLFLKLQKMNAPMKGPGH